MPAKKSATDFDIDIDVRDRAWREAISDLDAVVRRALMATSAAIPFMPPRAEVSVVLTDDAEQRALNARYRGKDSSTNVLSFPAMDADASAFPPGLPVALGDIVIARATVIKESVDQGLSLPHHFSHLLVHGMLHLLGFDHETVDEAASMEKLEVEILAGLGIDDPYADGAGNRDDQWNRR